MTYTEKQTNAQVSTGVKQECIFGFLAKNSMDKNKNPLPSAIKEIRSEIGISQTAAAALVHTTCRTWQQWEAGDRRMHPAFWELFKIKTNLA